MPLCITVLRSCGRISVLASLWCFVMSGAGFPGELLAEMTVRDYEVLRLSEQQQDRATLQLYVQGLINGLLWASTKAEKQSGLALVCNAGEITKPEQVYAIFDHEINRKGLTGSAKAVLPLGLMAVEALQREFPCHAPIQTGRTLMQGPRFQEYCNAEGDLPLKGICVGFVTAIADLIDSVPLYQGRACLQAGFKIKDGVSVVQRWMHAHPESVKYDAREIAIVALSETYPCTTRPNR